MTIRYACPECESVLKIRDELAGTKAKCPKCKTPFVIPSPEVTPAVVDETPVDTEPPIDMPLKITPKVDPADTDLYDTPVAPVAVVTSKGLAPGVPKPSVADLMREHEASKKKKHETKNKGNLEAAAAVAELVTAGSAADALTRNYDQKRGKTSEPPPLTREEQRAAEEKEAFKQFAIKGGAGLAATLVVLYFLIGWMLSESLPDLEYGHGIVMMNNAPMSGARVQFAPVRDPNAGENQLATPSVAYTDAAGKFVLMWDDVNEGVLPGKHNVTIMDINGSEFRLPGSDGQKEIAVGEDNEFNFNLSTGR